MLRSYLYRGPAEDACGVDNAGSMAPWAEKRKRGWWQSGRSRPGWVNEQRGAQDTGSRHGHGHRLKTLARDTQKKVGDTVMLIREEARRGEERGSAHQ